VLDSDASTPIRRTSAEPEPLLVVAFQTESRANGGLTSLGLVLERLERFRPVIVTQVESSLTDAWRRSGFDVRTVRLPHPARSADLVHRVVAFGRRAPALVAGQVEIFRRVRSTGARVVYFNDQNAFAFGALGARLAGAVVVLALRDTTGIDRWRWFSAAGVADVVVSLSRDMQARFERHLDARDPRRRVPRPEFVVVPSIAEVAPRSADRASSRREFGIAEGAFAIGVVGAVIPRKRQRDLVTALGPKLAAMDAELVFLGDFDPARDAYASSCVEARRASGAAERIRFEGFRSDVARWYDALDLVVVGSDHEGLARGMIEALAHGVPVVSTDVCSAPEVLDASGAGVVVPVGDFGALADAVVAMAADRESLARRGESARAFVAATFEARRIGLAYDRLFERLAATRPATSRTAST